MIAAIAEAGRQTRFPEITNPLRSSIILMPPLETARVVRADLDWPPTETRRDLNALEMFYFTADRGID
jgi:hypothetical protein